MKSPFIIVLALIVGQSTIAASAVALAHHWQEKQTILRAGVSVHDSVLAQAREAESRSRQLESEGAAKYSYQLYVSARSDLRNKFVRAAEQGGVVVLGGNVEDRKVEFNLGGSYGNALKFLSRVERDFPELRIRSTAWTAQRDGNVNITASWELWPIPTPVVTAKPSQS